MTRAWIALVGVLAGCDRTWTTPIAHVDHPVRARIDRIETSSGLAGKGQSGVVWTTYVLVAPGGVRHRIDDDHCGGPLELAADARGERLAVRCPGNPWHIVYLGAAGRAFESPTLAAPELPWADVPDFDHAARDLFRVASAAELPNPGGPSAADALLAEIAHRRGEAGLVRFLIATTDAPSTVALVPCPIYQQPVQAAWLRAYAALPAAPHAAVTRALVAIVEQPGAAPAALDKAVAVLDLDAPELAPAWTARLTELLAGPEPAGWLATSTLLRWYAARAPGAAADLACRRLGAGTLSENARVADLALAIAHARVPCPDLAAHARQAICGDRFVWDHSPAELASLVDAELARPIALQRTALACHAVAGSALLLPAAFALTGTPIDVPALCAEPAPPVVSLPP